MSESRVIDSDTQDKIISREKELLSRIEELENAIRTHEKVIRTFSENGEGNLADETLWSVLNKEK